MILPLIPRQPSPLTTNHPTGLGQLPEAETVGPPARQRTGRPTSRPERQPQHSLQRHFPRTQTAKRFCRLPAPQSQNSPLRAIYSTPPPSLPANEGIIPGRSQACTAWCRLQRTRPSAALCSRCLSLSLSLSSYSILPSDRRISSQKRTYLEEKKALPWLLPLIVRVSRFCCLVTTSTVLQGRACGSMTALSPSWVAGMVRVASSLKKYARVWLPKSRSAGSTGQRRFFFFPTEIEVAPPLRRFLQVTGYRTSTAVN